MATKKRSTTANGKKSPPRKSRPRTRKSAPPIEETLIEAEPVPEPPALVEAMSPVVTMVPEPSFAARIAPPPPPRPRPEQRRGIFFDVENTSRSQDIEFVLRHLMIDRVGIDTDFTAVGNWRVIGHETARLLAQNGAGLVHSAPSTGVRDWSDLRIAVAAGVWLAGARPGDMIDIVSDDQAFDAVGDVASSLGVQYRRLSYRSLRGHMAEEIVAPSPSSESRSRRGRGGRGRRSSDRRHEPRSSGHQAPMAPRHHTPPPMPAVAEDDGGPVHTAPHDELIEVVADLMTTSPNGVTLDQLANALRERGFRRTPGSPRLITRLKRIKELDISRNGLIRVGDDVTPAPVRQSAPARVESAADDEPFDIEPPSDEDGPDVESDSDADDATSEAAPADATAEGGQRRRRRRRGGRRRRGRRGNGNGSGGSGEGENGGEVIAAASITHEF